jgi:hypothetical protein
MATITKSYTFSAGATILASEHNQNFDVLYNWANGNVDNANIKAGAGISLSKLSLGDDVSVTGDWNFTNAATTDDIVTVTGSGLTTGSALKVYSNSSSTSTRNLVEIINDHADADDTVCLLIQQDGADYAIDCGATGKIRGDLSNSTFPAGSMVQVVNTMVATHKECSTATVYDDTIPQITEGDEVMTLAITPKSATNKLKIEVVVNGQTAGTNGNSLTALFQDTTANALAAGMNAGYSAGTSGSGSRGQCVITHYMDAGTTSETTFKVRVGPYSGGPFYFNSNTNARRLGGVMASSITITEIKV